MFFETLRSRIDRYRNASGLGVCTKLIHKGLSINLSNINITLYNC